jgi:hypothetical protein
MNNTKVESESQVHVGKYGEGDKVEIALLFSGQRLTKVIEVPGIKEREKTDPHFEEVRRNVVNCLLLPRLQEEIQKAVDEYFDKVEKFLTHSIDGGK